MKLMLCYLLLSLSPLCAPASPISSSVSNQQGGGTFASLDIAFSEVAALEDVELTLLPSLKPFIATTSVILPKRLWVRGERQSIQLSDTLYVAGTGHLTISNVSLLLSDAFRSARAFDVRGTFVLENSSLRELQTPLIWLYGNAVLTQVGISESKSVTILLKSGKAVLQLTSVSASRLGVFLVTFSTEEFLKTAATIIVTESKFEDTADLPVFSFYGGIGDIHIISSSFVRNLGVSLDIGGSGHKLLMQNCLFQDNNKSAAVLLRLSQAEVRIVNCTFTNNFDVGLHFWLFSGVVIVEDCVVSKARGAGFFYLLNDMTNIECRAMIRNSRISDINAETDIFHRSYVIGIGHCKTEISNVTIANVSLLALPPLNKNSLLFGEFTELKLSDITVIDSGSTTSWFNAQFCTLHLSNIRVDNYYSDRAVFFFAGGTTAYMKNIQIIGGSSTKMVEQRMFLFKTMYFVFFTSDIRMQNVSVSNSVEPMGPVFSLDFSNFSISDISLSHVSIGTVLGSLMSNGSMSDVLIDRISGDMHAILILDCVLSLSNITITNSQLVAKSGVFVTAKTSAIINNISTFNLTMQVLIMCSRATIEARHLVIDRSTTMWSACSAVSSVVSLEYVTMQESVIQRLSYTNCNLTIQHSAFTSLRSRNFFVEAVNSNVSFINVSLSSISTMDAFTLITHGSSFSIDQCDFERLHAEGELGWQILDSTLNVSNTHARNFNFGLFQAHASNISLLSCHFAEGVNPVQSLRSPAAFGGVLSCVDCPIVSIKDSKCVDISAKVGGAVAVKRRDSFENLYLTVDNSVFIRCVAHEAGALFIQNMSFTINDSVFARNTAERTGGGIFAAIKPWHKGFIRNSHFSTNMASEGGAVKWSNAPVLFSNVTFQENSAAYGPDIASYGVALSTNLTHLKGTKSTGYIIDVAFELLDHYNHRVSISPLKNLLLLSSPTIAYRGNNATLLRWGWFNFSELTVYAPPASVQTIQAVLIDSQEDFALTITGEVTLHCRSCIPGEIHRSDRCEYCYPGYYSFSPSDSDCSFCPANAFCPGGRVLEVNPGYWRSTWNSSDVLLCPFPAKCLGGQNSTCLFGFQGVLCNQCAPSTTRIRAMECVECRVVLVVLQLCASVIMILLLRWGILRLCVYRASPNKLFVVKVVISHCQYLSALCFLRVSFSGVINWSLHAVGLVSALLVPDFPLVCLGASEPEYAKALIGSLLPTALLLLEWLWYLAQPSESRMHSSRIISSSLLYYTPYITLFTSIPLLACQNANSTHQVLFLNMNETCWEGAHFKYVRALVLPSLILNLAGPIVVILTVRIVRPLLFDRYFPLWNVGYKVKLYDVYLCALQYFFLCTIILTTALNPLQQDVYCFIVLIVVCTGNVSLQQWIYTSPRHFLLAEASVLTVSLSLGFLSYYIVYLPTSTGSEFFAVAMVLLLNAIFYGLSLASIANNWLDAKKSDSLTNRPAEASGDVQIVSS